MRILFFLLFIIPAFGQWNLDRIDQRYLPFDLQYNSAYTGQGVTVYVVDSGLQIDHPDFEGRAEWGYGRRQNEQCDGHATGVAGVVGSHSYGVAKQVHIVSVKVRCFGYATAKDLISGLDWVYRDASHNRGTSIAVIPLGTTLHIGINDAVRKLVGANVLPVVSAGNSSRDACYDSPSSVLEALVVGGTRSDDSLLSYTNYGSCVDIYAPGEGVWTIWNGSVPLTYMSGTSFAAPHGAGVAALYLETHPYASPREVHDAVVNNSTYLGFPFLYSNF